MNYFFETGSEAFVEANYKKLEKATTTQEAFPLLMIAFEARRALYLNFRYRPPRLGQLHHGQRVTLLPLLNNRPGVQVITPRDLPPSELDFLDTTGKKSWVFQQIQYIFFITDPEVERFLNGTTPNTLATVEHASQSVLILANSPDDFYPGMLAAVLIHEAHHIGHDHKYENYPQAEIPAYQMEIEALQTLQAHSTDDRLINQFERRINGLKKSVEKYY